MSYMFCREVPGHQNQCETVVTTEPHFHIEYLVLIPSAAMPRISNQ